MPMAFWYINWALLAEWVVGCGGVWMCGSPLKPSPTSKRLIPLAGVSIPTMSESFGGLGRGRPPRKTISTLSRIPSLIVLTVWKKYRCDVQLSTLLPVLFTFKVICLQLFFLLLLYRALVWGHCLHALRKVKRSQSPSNTRFDFDFINHTQFFLLFYFYVLSFTLIFYIHLCINCSQWGWIDRLIDSDWPIWLNDWYLPTDWLFDCVQALKSTVDFWR
jgi:hypothetical protein